MKPRRWFLTPEMVEARKIAEQGRFLEVAQWLSVKVGEELAWSKEQMRRVPHVLWVGEAPEVSGSMGVIENFTPKGWIQ